MKEAAEDARNLINGLIGNLEELHRLLHSGVRGAELQNSFEEIMQDIMQNGSELSYMDPANYDD